jgi:BirA family transcriptional regulator, biotin operon repressor / biotin---[acetyl-CoA-carboxylase] ligase
MGFALGQKALARGYRLAAFDTIGSTSSEAMERGRAGDAGRLWVVAREQTAGHGRRGRPWQTPRGNLAASLLLVLPAGGAPAATLGFAAGLAVKQAIGRCCSEDSIRLKWPNDVLIDGAKVAGILLEAVTLAAGYGVVVIGIGVNAERAPEGVPYPATSLAACSCDASPESLFETLSDSWVEQEELWNDGIGFAAIRDRWLHSAAGLGSPIAVHMGESVFRGTFETIDADGRLVVRSEDGSARMISAGEVHFGAAATTAL